MHHYTGKALSCDEVVSTVGTSEGLDVAQDPVEVLECHWGIGSRDAYADFSPALSHAPLYVRNDSEERCLVWWLDLRTSVDAKHPVFLLGERLDAKTVCRDPRQRQLLPLLAGSRVRGRACDGTVEQRRAGRDAARAAPASQGPLPGGETVEATLEAEGGAVQLHTFARGDRGVDRFRP